MADEPVGFYNVQESIRIFLGPLKENFVLKGVGPDVFASYAPSGDQGAAVDGAAGAVMLVTRRVRSFTLTLVFMPTATGMAALGTLDRLGKAFAVNIVAGNGTDSERLQGRGVIQNSGNVEFSATGTPRTVTIAVGATTYNMGPIGERLDD